MTLTRIGTAVVLSSLFCLAQAQKRPEFEVASIRPSDPGSDTVHVGVHLDGAMVRINYLSVKEYIASAYNMKLYQVVAPDWTAGARFDISAKLPDGSKRDDMNDMLKSLLEDRFQMKAHPETREFPVYALTVSKSPVKLTEVQAEASDPAGTTNVAAQGGRGGVFVNMGNGGSFSFANNELDVKKILLASFCESLSRFMDRPVVDMTGLKGNYDFTLKLTPEDYMGMLIRSGINAGANIPPQALAALDTYNGESLTNSLDALGLKLEKRKAPLAVIVIDHVEKTPTGN